MSNILKQLKEYIDKTPKDVLQAVENSKKKVKFMTENEVMRYLISTKK